MKLKNNDAINLFKAIAFLEGDGVYLSAPTRLALAKNSNRLKPHMENYDKVVGAKRREIRPSDAKLESNNAIVKEIEEFGSTEIEVRLYKIEEADLKLEENKRISAVTIAHLSPIIKGFDSNQDEGE